MANRKQITKSEVRDEFDEVFELTNIKVKEVSLVDRAANKRKFLVVKNDKKRAGDPVTADDVETALGKARETLVGTPAAELDRRDAAAKSAPEAPRVAPEAPSVASEPAIVTEPVAEPVAKEILEVVVVQSQPSYAAGSAEDILLTKLRAAWIGGLDAIRARLDAAVEAVNRPTDGIYVSWDAYGHIDAIRCMLECFYGFGGPEWEIEVAAVTAAAAKGENVTKKHEELKKIGRAISGQRMRSLKDMHGLVSDLQKRFDALLADVEAEPETEKATTVKTDVLAEAMDVVSAATPVAIVAPTVVAPPNVIVASAPEKIAAPVTALDITQNPAFKALAESMKAQQTEIERLRNVSASQEQALAKAKGTIRSNALTPEPPANHNDHVVWPRDMASPASRVSSRIRR